MAPTTAANLFWVVAQIFLEVIYIVLSDFEKKFNTLCVAKHNLYINIFNSA